MRTPSPPICCDGCGLPASPEHIAERLERLELATRYRPIHISVLFAALAPSLRLQDDFYRPPETKNFFESFLTALDVPGLAGKALVQADDAESSVARLIEFQRRGYYLSYLSECPVTPQPSESRTGPEQNTAESISRLALTLLKRIQLNYRPQHIALIGSDLFPLIEFLNHAGAGPLLLLDHGRPLEVPQPGDTPALSRFRAAIAAVATHCAPSTSSSMV